MTKFSFGVQCTVYLKLLHRQTSITLMLRHLSQTFNMLLPVSAHAVNEAKCHYIHIETHAWFCNMVISSYCKWSLHVHRQEKS